MICATTWMKLEDIMQSERSQIQNVFWGSDEEIQEIDTNDSCEILKLY